MRPIVGITMGDAAGVGPEIIVKACRRLMPRIDAGGLRVLVIGHRIRGSAPPVTPIVSTRVTLRCDLTIILCHNCRQLMTRCLANHYQTLSNTSNH